MIDWDDVDFAILASPSGGVGAVVGLVVVAVLAFYACQNTEDCASKSCARGTPQLMNNECLCVEKAK